MNTRTILIFVAALCATITTEAKGPSAKKHKPNVRLLTAYEEQKPGAQPQFILVWQGTKYPETFFWRGDNGWLPCRMEKAHKQDRDSQMYTSESISAGDIHRGDTLSLVPVTGGRFALPKEIPATAKNTLYYKTGGTGWLSFPVKKIVKIMAE
jgi:hypothetical protein